MKKKLKLLFMLAILATIFTSCKKSSISLINEKYTTEVGQALPDTVDTYATGNEEDLQKAKVDTSNVDINTLGEYDASVNYSKEEHSFKVDVVDETAPILSGVKESISIKLGEELNILDGVVAEDNYDGDITSNIEIDTSNVDTNTVGEYTAKISVSDTSGNKTEQDVKIIVKQMSILNPASEMSIGDLSQYSTENVPFGVGTNMDAETNRPTGLEWYSAKYGQYAVDFIQPNSNEIFLTFDEGYEYGYTPAILDTLKEKNVKAVFFVTLPYAKENPDLVQRMIDEGHVVGNHSATHPAAGMASISKEQQIDEIKQVDDYVRENFNYQMYLFRFPTGAFSEQSLAIVQSLGYRSVFWSFAHRDWITDDQPDEAQSLQNCLNKAHGGAIYLLHAVSKTNTNILGDFIDKAREKGFEFGYYDKVD